MNPIHEKVSLQRRIDELDRVIGHVELIELPRIERSIEQSEDQTEFLPSPCSFPDVWREQKQNVLKALQNAKRETEGKLALLVIERRHAYDRLQVVLGQVEFAY